MKLFLCSVTMLVVVVVNSHHGGQREPPEPKPPYGPDYKSQLINALLESKYNNEITLASPETSNKDLIERKELDGNLNHRREMHRDYAEYYAKAYTNEDCHILNVVKDLDGWGGVELCKTTCSSMANCNAINTRFDYVWIYPSNTIRCELINCPVPIPFPSGTNNWPTVQTAYSIIEDYAEYHGLRYTAEDCPNIVSNVIGIGGIAVEKCKTTCSSMATCNSFNINWYGPWRICELLNCPVPIPFPSGNGDTAYTIIQDPCLSRGGQKVLEQCIIINDDSRTWSQAVSACEAKDQRLAVLQDPEAFHAYMLLNHKGEKYWLGATDKEYEGKFTWINGQSLAGFPWGPRQPSNSGSGQDCLEWGYGNNYNDAGCRYTRGYVCEPYKRIKKIELSDVIYGIDRAKTLSKPATIKRSVVKNYLNLPQSSTLVITYSYETSKNWGNSNGGIAAVSSTIESGIPFIVKGSITVSLAASYEQTWGEAETTTESDQIRATITVPAKSQSVVWVSYIKNQIDIPYKAVMKKYYEDGTSIRETFTGVFEGVDATEFHIVYGEAESLI